MDIELFTRILGIIFAWLGFALLLIFALKPLLRRTKKLPKLRMFLIKQHTLMGVLCIVFVLLHIIFSHSKLFTVMGGKLATVFMVISVIAYFFRKKLKKNFMKVHGIFALLCLVFVCWHIVETNFDFSSEQGEYVIGEGPFDGLDLVDGEYDGSSTGYSGEIVVLVTIKNSVIVDIVITKSNETSVYINKVESTLKKYFIEEQDSNVDVLTGATLSSNGYINAVLNAVDKATI